MREPDYDQIARGLAETHASPYPPAYIPKAAEAIAAALRAADAAGEARGVAAERERCAGIAEHVFPNTGDERALYRWAGALDIAAAIRRGE